MSKEKDILKRFDEQGFTDIVCQDYQTGKETSQNNKIKQFLLTELQALKEDVMGEEQEYVIYDETWGDTERNSNDVRTGINLHRNHAKEVFQKFGIK